MAPMIKTLRLSLASKSTEIRSALDQHMPWIRTCMGDDGANLIQLRFDHSLASVAAQRLFGPCCRTAIPDSVRSVLDARLQRVEFPPGIPPAAAMRLIALPRTPRAWNAEWLDCPVALYFSGLAWPMIAANISCVDGASQGSQWREVTLANRQDIPGLLALMGEAFGPNRLMKVMGEESVQIQPLAWNDLVLEDSIIRLIRDDFQLFLEREEWYRRHRLPFRRGYLLHGPTARAS